MVTRWPHRHRHVVVVSFLSFLCLVVVLLLAFSGPISRWWAVVQWERADDGRREELLGQMVRRGAADAVEAWCLARLDDAPQPRQARLVHWLSRVGSTRAVPQYLDILLSGEHRAKRGEHPQWRVHEAFDRLGVAALPELAHALETGDRRRQCLAIDLLRDTGPTATAMRPVLDLLATWKPEEEALAESVRIVLRATSFSEADPRGFLTTSDSRGSQPSSEPDLEREYRSDHYTHDNPPRMAVSALRELGVSDLMSLRDRVADAGKVERTVVGRLLGTAVMSRRKTPMDLIQGTTLGPTTVSSGLRVTELLPWLGDSSPTVRATALAAVVQVLMRPVTLQMGGHEARQTLIDEIAAVAGTIRPALSRSTESADETVRSRAFLARHILDRYTLASERRTPTPLPEPARQCLDDEEPFVRTAAALWAFVSEEAPFRAVRLLLESPSGTAWIYARVRSWVLRTRAAVAVEACTELLHHPATDVQERAVRTLIILADWRVEGARDALDLAPEQSRRAAEAELEDMIPWDDLDLESQYSIASTIQATLRVLGPSCEFE